MKLYFLLLMWCAFVKSYSIDQRSWSRISEERNVKVPTVNVEKQETFLDTINNCPEDDDLASNTSVTCHGVKVVRRIMGQLLDQGTKRNYRLSDGVEFVKVAEGSRNLGSSENSVIGRMQNFLQTHELRVKLQDFLPNSEEWGRAYNGSLLQQIGEGVFTGRGKKGGGGGLLALALLFKGMLAAIGLGGLGLLAMKALMVSLLALMLSALVGVRRGGGGGQDGAHH